MFDLITNEGHAVPRGGRAPLLLSIGAHVVAIAALVVVPLIYATSDLPEVPDMLAFVVAAPSPPPPPPPPPPPAAPRTAVRPRPAPQPVSPAVLTVPVEPVRDAVVAALEPEFTGVDEGIEGGVEGGIPGGIVGGIVGGLVTNDAVPPPPPPPPAPVVERAPVRIGGGITAPALVTRVEPVYPPLAVAAQVQGVVILEAMVDRTGHVEQVKVLRSIPLLDAAAVNAVRQWRYSPLLLNGKAEKFVLTVTLSFSLNA